MSRKTILITGASGFIGAHLFEALKEQRPIGFSRQESSKKENFLIKCDLTNQIDLKKNIMEIKPDIIFHLAAMTNPKRNEKKPEEARLLNVGITKNLIDIIDTEKTHLIFLSTDKVFDGTNNNPDENSKTNPLWIYSSLKLECEKVITEKVKKYHIIRLPIVHGYGEGNASSFIDEAIINLSQKKHVNAFDNVKRCYVKIDEIIDFLTKLIKDSNYGIYHAGSVLMNYYDRITLLCREKGIDVNSLLIPVKGSAKPLIQNLNTKKFEQTFNFSFS